MSDHLAAHHPATLDLQQLVAQCQVRHSRASGPGGQHRNKVQTAVHIRHDPTGITGMGQERRSQAQNLKAAIFRLRVNLALQVRCPIGQDKVPSMLWRSRCVAGRIRVNVTSRDFPAMLAEAMDVIVALNMDVGGASKVLGCSLSQLLKLLRAEPRALAWVNQVRQETNKHPLR